MGFIGENAKGSTLGTRKLLKKLDQNFWLMAILKFRVILGQITPRVICQHEFVKFGKKARFLRRIFRFVRLFSSRAREENKMTKSSMDFFLGTNLVPNGK